MRLLASQCCFRIVGDHPDEATFALTVATLTESLEAPRKTAAAVDCHIVNDERSLVHVPNLEVPPGITVIAVGLTYRVPAIR